MSREQIYNWGQLIITVGITGVTVFLFATGIHPDEALLALNGLIVGHYFGSAAKTNGAFEAGRKVGADSSL